jgi:hypothetical protein
MIVRELEYALPEPRKPDVRDERSFAPQKNSRRAVNNSHVHDHDLRLSELDQLVPLIKHILNRAASHASFEDDWSGGPELSSQRLIQQERIRHFQQLIAADIFARQCE